MGLDSVEIVMAWEDAFGVHVPDAEAAEMRTIRDAIDYFYARVKQVPSLTCLSQRAFYRMRRALVTTAGVPRREVTLDRRVKDLLPRPWRPAWASVGAASEFTAWPRLGVGAGPTLRDVARDLVRDNSAQLLHPEGGWSREQVRRMVRSIVCHETGLDDTFEDDASFVDLGLN